MKKEQMRRLREWQDRLQDAENEIRPELDRMGKRESIYNGDHTIYKPDGTVAKKGSASHVRNLGFELVETQVESSIPSPKVTAIRAEDEPLADIIENLLRNVLDRLPFERINDEGERISPIQGGHGLLVDWQDGISGRDWMGDLRVTMMHPRGIIPQAGVYQVADMDWIFLKTPATRRQIKTSFGVALEEENESDPDARRLGDSPDSSGEIVTLVTCYYRNSAGGIGRFRWVNDTVLEDLEDYQLRRVHRCSACGAVGDGHKCRYCGGTRFDVEVQEFEELTEDITTANGTVIPALSEQRDEFGQPVLEPLTAGEAVLPQLRPPNGPAAVRYAPVMAPTRIPYYKPDVYPIVIRKNVSQSGRFMGSSDIDAIADQQNTMNQISTKIKTKVLGGGSFTTIPSDGVRIVSDEDNKVIRVDNPAKMQMIKTYNTQVDINMDLALRSQIYEEARQIIGITDSLQGRKDPTATSAVAKEFSAQQAAGRLESKRVMKRAMYQDLFEVIFKFFLAYCEEPRMVHKADENGKTQYLVFDRHDFLYQDEAGEWKYNTDFLFSCDSAAPLANDRQALWKEARMNFQQGAMGPVNEVTTLLRFWTQMEKLHYPMAGDMRRSFEDEVKRRQEQQMQQIASGGMAQEEAGAMMPGAMGAMTEGGGMA